MTGIAAASTATPFGEAIGALTVEGVVAAGTRSPQGAARGAVFPSGVIVARTGAPRGWARGVLTVVGFVLTSTPAPQGVGSGAVIPNGFVLANTPAPQGVARGSVPIRGAAHASTRAPQGVAMGVPTVTAHRYIYAHLADDGATVDSAGYSGVQYPPAIATALKAVPITQVQFDLMHAGGSWRWVDGAPVLVPVPPIQLGAAQARALVQIDRTAEMVRQLFLTPGAGQAMEYQETQADAKRAIAAAAAGETLTGADYPWLDAERLALADAAAGSPTLLQVAQGVVSIMDGWTTVGSGIKRLRRAAKLSVATCTTTEAVAAVLAGMTWPSAPS